MASISPLIYPFQPSYEVPAVVMPSTAGKSFAEFAQEYARTNNANAVRALNTNQGVPTGDKWAAWDPQWDYAKVAAAEQAAGRKVTPKSWQRQEYDRPEYRSTFGVHMAGLPAALETIPLEEGGLKEPDPGTGLIGSLIAGGIGLATGNPLIGAFAGATVGNSSGTLGGALMGAVSGGLSGYNSGGILGRGSTGGFYNPGGLGLSGSNLSLPGLVNAPATGTITGYGPSALGLSGLNLALPGLANATPAVPVSGYGGSALGGNPASLYQPASTTPRTTSSTSTNGLGRAASALLESASTPTAGGGLLAPSGAAGGRQSSYSASVPHLSSVRRRYADFFAPNRFMRSADG